MIQLADDRLEAGSLPSRSLQTETFPAQGECRHDLRRAIFVRDAKSSDLAPSLGILPEKASVIVLKKRTSAKFSSAGQPDEIFPLAWVATAARKNRVYCQLESRLGTGFCPVPITSGLFRKARVTSYFREASLQKFYAA
jgi:hypothetical protein